LVCLLLNYVHIGDCHLTRRLFLQLIVTSPCIHDHGSYWMGVMVIVYFSSQTFKDKF
jgi:hypothetical protein